MLRGTLILNCVSILSFECCLAFRVVGRKKQSGISQHGDKNTQVDPSGLKSVCPAVEGIAVALLFRRRGASTC